jgi:hypothetical protein
MLFFVVDGLPKILRLGYKMDSGFWKTSTEFCVIILIVAAKHIGKKSG